MKGFFKYIILIVVLVFASVGAMAATYYSIATGNWTSNTTWSLTIGGSAVGSGVYPTTGDIVYIQGNKTVTITSGSLTSLTLSNLNISNGSVLTLPTYSSTSNRISLTISSSLNNAGTINVNNNYLYLTGGSANSNSGSILFSTGRFYMNNNSDLNNTGAIQYSGNGRIYFTGSFTNSGTSSLSGTTVYINSGTTNSNTSIAGFSTTGTVSFGKTTGTATLTGNVTGGALTISGNGGTLNLGVNLTHTFSGALTLSTGSTLNGGSSNINFTGSTVLSGTPSGIFTAGTSTVTYSGNSSQTCPVLTYNNLTLSGAGVKTFSTTPTVNGVLSMEGTASVTVTTGVITYGANATLQYNKPDIYTATSEEWITPFTALGGIIIKNAGDITLGSNVQIGNNSNVPLNINTNATLNTGSYTLTFHGNFINDGTLISDVGGVVIAGTSSVQSIAGFTTKGNLSMTKTSGTATLSGSVTAVGLVINGSGGTLNLGNATPSLSHSFSGTYSSTNGTLNAGNSNLNFTGTGTIVSIGSGTFSASTGTVNYTGANQTIGSLTYNNLTLSGSGTKTYNGTTFSVNNTTEIQNVTVSLPSATFTSKYLVINGIGQPSGYYGASTVSGVNYSPATFSSSGTGKLNVTTTSNVNTSTVLSKYWITFPGETFVDGSGNTGTAADLTAGINNITIHATNSINSTINTYTGSYSLTIVELSSVNSVLNSYTTNVDFTNGVATNLPISIPKSGSSIKIEINNSGNYTNPSSPINVNAGVASMLVFSTNPTDKTAGTTFSDLTIKVEDQFGNLSTTNTTVVLTVSGNATLFGTISKTTNTGTANFVFADNIYITKSGTYTLTASASGLSNAVSSSFIISAAAASKISFSTQPGNGVVNSVLSPQPEVVFQDQYNNLVTTATDLITLTISNNPTSAELTSTAVSPNSDGKAVFTDVSLSKTGTGFTLTATSSGSTNFTTTSSAFNVVNSGAAKIIFTNSPVKTNAGNYLTPIVQVQDASGNPILTGTTGSNAVIALTVTSGTLYGTNTMTATDGTADFTNNNLYLLTKGNNYTLSASTTISGINYSATSDLFDITAAAASQIAINAGNSLSATVGSNLSTAPAVIVKDAYNNVVSGASVTFTVVGGGGSIGTASATTDANGIATTSWTLGTTAGTNTLTASISSATVTFTATGTAGSPTQVIINGSYTQSAIAGSTISSSPPSVVVKDTYNNVVSGASVSFSVTGGGGSVNPSSVTTNASGIASLTGWTLGSTAGTNTLTATVGSASATFTATGTAGSATQISINGSYTQSATAGSIISSSLPSVIVKDANNNVVSGASVTFSVTGGGGSVSPSSVTTNASGIATISSWTLGTTSGTNTLTATVGSVTTTFTATGTVGAVSASNSTVSASTTNVDADAIAYSTISITLKDANSNIIPNTVVNLTSNSSNAIITAVNNTTDASGIATFTVKDGVAETVTLTANSSVNISTTVNVTFVTSTVFRVAPHVTQPTCYSLGSVDLIVTGGTAPYKYDWSDLSGSKNIEDRVGLTAGNTYTVFVTDALGNTISATTGVLTTPSCASGAVTVCKTETSSAFSIDADPANTSYDWTVKTISGTAKTTAIPGSTSSSITVNWTGYAIGEYQVCVIASNSCTVSAQQCQTVFVKQPTIAAFADPTCEGANLNLHAYGATNYSWTGPNAFTSNTSDPIIYNATSTTANGTYTLTATDANGCTASSSISLSFSTDVLPSITGSLTQATCAGATGTISTTVTGGSGFTYLWEDNSTNANRSALATGNYLVKVTNGSGCSTEKSFTITASDGPTIGTPTSLTNVSCYGGANGAVVLPLPVNATYAGSYSYTWTKVGTGTISGTTGSLSNLSAGNYAVQITDANSCKTGTEITITQPPAPLTAEATLTNVNCNSASTGGISLNVSGGSLTPSYTYSWIGTGSYTASTKNISNLSAGTYTVTITDVNGSCTYTNSYTITQPSGVLTTTATVTAVNCFGGNTGIINLNTTGGTSPYTYAWSKVGGGYTASTSSISGIAAGTYSVTITDNKGCALTPTGIAVSEPSAALSFATSTITPVSCNNGSDGAITISATGGTSSYTYAWSNGASSATISNLSAGTYTATVTDNNSCTYSQGFTITQPANALSASISSVAPSCYNGTNASINLTVSGGTTNYTYAWTKVGAGSFSATTEDLSSLTAGTYNVTVTDSKNCTVVKTETITDPTALSLSGLVTNANCNGGTGSINITATGGTGTLSYNWGGGIISEDRTSIAAGNYSVTVSDVNSCTINGSYSITEPTALNVTGAKTNILCNAGLTGSISLTVAGGVAPYTYSWTGSASYSSTNKDISNLAAGTYTVTVTDNNNCTSVQSFTLTQPSAALSAIATPTAPLCNGGSTGSVSLAVTGGTSAYTFAWTKDGVSSFSQTTQNLTALSAGVYNVTVTDANNCTVATSATVTDPTALALSGAVTNNTCNGASTGAIDITATGGTGVLTYNWGSTITTEDRTGLAAGTYSVTVSDHNSCTVNGSYTITQPTAVTATLTNTNLTCNNSADGSIALTVTGGAGPYTYAWSGPNSFAATTKDISALTVGRYSVIITDANNCTANYTSAEITQPTAFAVSISASTNINCYNDATGAATALATGGTVGTGYKYKWTDGTVGDALTNVKAGSYTVTATDVNGCSANASVSITQPSKAIAVYASATDTRACAGTPSGKIDLVVENATGTLTYTWTGPTTIGNIKSPSNLAAGDYSVVVSNSDGCTASISKTVGTSAALVVTVDGFSRTCATKPDGSAYAVVSGGVAPYTYLWSNTATTQSISSLTTDTYSVDVTDANGCTSKASTTLTAPTCDIPVAVTDVFVSSNGATISNTIATNDIDSVYNKADLQFQLLASPSATQGSIKAELTGEFTFTPAAGYNGTVEIPYMVSNPLGLSDRTTLNIYVSNMTVNATVVDATCTAGGSITLSVTDGFPGYTYYWTDNNTFTSKQKDLVGLSPGTYYVSITDSKGATTSRSYTINEGCIPPPGASTIYISGKNAFTYNGSAQGPTTTKKHGSSGAITIVYIGTGTTNYPSSTTAPTGIGTYKAIATLDADATYTGATSEDFEFTIDKVPSTIIVTGLTSYTYNKLAQGPITSTVTGSTITPTYSYYGTGSTSYGPSATKPTNVGTYEVVANVDADENYTSASSKTYAFNIVKASTTIEVTGLITYAYNGVGQGPITSNVVGSTATPTYSYYGTGTTIYPPSAILPINAGTYEVVASVEADANYNSATSAAFAFTISQNASTIVVTGLTTYTYNGTVQGPATSNVTGSTGTVTYSYRGVNGTVYGPSATAPTLAGKYTVIATVASDGTYSAASSVAYEFVIDPAPVVPPVVVPVKPQASLNLIDNGLLKTDTAQLKFTFTDGTAPFKAIISNNINSKIDTLSNLINGSKVAMGVHTLNTIFKIEKVIDAAGEIRADGYTKDTALLSILKPLILLTLKAEPAIKQPDNSFKTQLSLKIKNAGELNLNNVQVNANLSKVFPAGVNYKLDSVKVVKGNLQINPTYKGNGTATSPFSVPPTKKYLVSSTIKSNAILDPNYLFNNGVNLAIAEEGEVVYYLSIAPTTSNVTLQLQFTSSAAGVLQKADGSISAQASQSSSQDGAAIDQHPDLTGIGTAAPTYLPLFSNVVIGASLNASTATKVAGGYIYHMVAKVVNYGNENVDSLLLTNNFATSFTSPDSAYIINTPQLVGPIVLNPNFDGYNNKNLLNYNASVLVGDSIMINYDLFIKSSKTSNTWTNSFTVSGVSLVSGTTIRDISTSGLNPDPNGDSNPLESDLTKLYISYNAPLPPVVVNGNYIYNTPTNPTSLNSLVKSYPTGTIPVWCDIVTAACSPVAPSMPTLIGKFIYQVRSYDTTTLIYSTSFVNDTVVIRPPVPTVLDSTYIIGLTTNPANVSVQVTGMTGSTLSYYINAIDQNTAPKLGNVPGVYRYTVSQTVNSISSDTVGFKVTMLDVNDVIHLQKIVDSGLIQANSTFNYKFTFVVTNLTKYPFTNVVVSDNLQNSVPLTSGYSVLSTSASSPLVANNIFNGNSDLVVAKTTTSLPGNSNAEASFVMNLVPNGYNGSLANTATVSANTIWGKVNMVSSSTTHANETTKQATNYYVEDLKVNIPSGFSPNHDGVNDYFVIIRPANTTIELEVFNRWGNIVYENKNYNNEWDGKGSGNFTSRDLVDGGYYYIVKAIDGNNKVQEFKGYIIIQR